MWSRAFLMERCWRPWMVWAMERRLLRRRIWRSGSCRPQKMSLSFCCSSAVTNGCAPRGVGISFAAFNAVGETMTLVGVGNVEGILLQADPAVNPRYESLTLRSGVVGTRLPLLHAAIVPVKRGDTLIFATDGIRTEFAQRLALDAGPQQIADRILAQYAKGTDDALVLVARYVGEAA